MHRFSSSCLIIKRVVGRLKVIYVLGWAKIPLTKREVLSSSEHRQTPLTGLVVEAANLARTAGHRLRPPKFTTLGTARPRLAALSPGYTRPRSHSPI